MLDSPVLFRLWVFFGLFFIFTFLESVFPKNLRKFKRTERWPINLSIVFLGSGLTKILAMIVPIALPLNAAIFAKNHSLGLFQLIQLPSWVLIVLGILLLDFIIYVQHFFFHRVACLWKLHSIHHLDRDLDVSSALRFHPIEICISILIKCIFILVLGINPLAVLIFEIILNGMAQFNHANLKLNSKLDEILSFFVVTPDMHRIHHSVCKNEAHSNFGFSLSIWDKIFKTFKKLSSSKQDAIVFGHPDDASTDNHSLFKLLVFDWKNR